MDLFLFLALVITAGTVLALGLGLRALVDEGFAAGNADLLNNALLVMLGVIIVLAIGSFSRFFLVSWIGERVVADMRRRVFDHILKLSPAYYELTRTGEVLSRLTTDTTLLQTVVGSSVSIAIRNFLLLIGGTVLLVVTSLSLGGFMASMAASLDDWLVDRVYYQVGTDALIVQMIDPEYAEVKERLKAKLAKNYTNAHITTYQNENETFYRVRVGKFSNLKKAIEYEKILKKDGYDPMIVAE